MAQERYTEDNNSIKQNEPAIKANVNNESNEIDLKDIIIQLWQKRKFILLITAISLAIGLFIALALPVQYSASCTAIPQTGESNRANLGGMASMMGINLGSTMPTETLSPAIYPKIVKSTLFCKEIMETSITVEKSKGTPITLYEYYSNPIYRDKNLMNSVKKYTIGLPRTILGIFRSVKEEESSMLLQTDSITGQVITLTRREKRVIESIRDNIQFSSNSRDRYISLGYTFAEPQAAADITQKLYNTLERYVKEYKTEKQTDNLQFVEINYKEAQQDFLKKQGALATFQDANRSLTTALARTTEQRLRSEYDIAFTIYNELAKQLEQAKLSVKESTPVFTVIEPVVVPHQKVAPRRSIILIISIFIGFVISAVIVLVKPFFHDIVNTIKIDEST